MVMTKLEQEICNVIVWDTPGDNARAAAEVAKKYIEKAFDVDMAFWAMQNNYWGRTREEIIQAYLKENGII